MPPGEKETCRSGSDGESLITEFKQECDCLHGKWRGHKASRILLNGSLISLSLIRSDLNQLAAPMDPNNNILGLLNTPEATSL